MDIGTISLVLLLGMLFLLAIGWIITLKSELFSVFGQGFSGKDLILLAGGLFLIYKAIFLVFTWTGALFQATAVVDFGDMMILGMAFPNVLGLYFMSNVVAKELSDYEQKLEQGIIKRHD